MANTLTFELPQGYEAPDGTVHKEVEMRRVRNRDIINIQKDMTLQAMVKENLDMKSGNPMVTMRINAQVLQLFVLLFSQVVVRIGSIEKPGKEVFLDMFQMDMGIMMERYAEMNGVSNEELQAMKEGKIPFASETLQ